MVIMVLVELQFRKKQSCKRTKFSIMLFLKQIVGPLIREKIHPK